MFGLFRKQKSSVLTVYSDERGVTESRIMQEVREIAENAFSYCPNLRRIIIPKGVTKIALHAFTGCPNLEAFVVDEENPRYRAPAGILMDETTVLRCPRQMKRAVLPEGITVIGEEAFKDCACLRSVVLPESLRTIADSAFRNCRALEHVVLPPHLEQIGEYAFAGCSALEDMKFLEDGEGNRPGIKAADSALIGCDSLKTMRIPDDVTITLPKYMESMEMPVNGQWMLVPLTDPTKQPPPSNQMLQLGLYNSYYLPANFVRQQLRLKRLETCRNEAISALVAVCLVRVGAHEAYPMIRQQGEQIMRYLLATGDAEGVEAILSVDGVLTQLDLERIIALAAEQGLSAITTMILSYQERCLGYQTPESRFEL